jgi:outer membrane protein assembly factor BamA
MPMRQQPVMPCHPVRALAALAACCSSTALLAAGPQMTTATEEAMATVQAIPAQNPPPPDARPDVLIVPIPQSSPSLGTGLTLGGGVFYNPNGSKEPWTTGGAVMATSNGSWALGAGHKMFLSQDRIKLTAFAGYGDVNLRFYGIGPNAGERNSSVDINDTGFVAFVDPQLRIAPNFYVGVRALYLDLKVSLRGEPPEDLPIEEIPLIEFDSRLVQLGPVAVYDSRDNSLYPRQGVYAQASWLMGVPGLGSDYANDRVTLYANFYDRLSDSTVFAARLSTCAVSRGSPFYDICLYGASSDLRGYETGRFRDRASWAGQMEVRHRLKGRFGVAAFAGVGGIASSFDDIGNSTVLPAVGAGLRWQASKETPINLRIDVAAGKDSTALYISVGEAF